MQGKSTVSGNKASAKAHVIAVHKGAGVSLSIHHSEIHRVTSCGNAGLTHTAGSEVRVKGSQGCLMPIMFMRFKFLSRKISKSFTGITTICFYNLANFSNESLLKCHKIFYSTEKKNTFEIENSLAWGMSCVISHAVSFTC